MRSAELITTVLQATKQWEGPKAPFPFWKQRWELKLLFFHQRPPRNKSKQFATWRLARSRWTSCTGNKFTPLASKFSGCLCLTVPPHLDAGATAGIQLHGAEQTHRKPLTWGELRVSSLITAQTKVFGGTKDLTDEITVETITFGVPCEPWNSLTKAATGGHHKFPPHTETRQVHEWVSADLDWDVLHGANLIAAALTQTLAYRQLGQDLGFCKQRMVLMSVHKQHPVNQDHRDHLCVENLDSRRIQPRWVEFNAFPLTATGSAESLLRMCLEDCFLWRWGSITGTVPSLRGLPSWLKQFVADNTERCVWLWFKNFWAYNTRSCRDSFYPKRCKL